MLKVFDLYAPAFSGEVLKDTVNSPAYGKVSKAINSVSIRKQGSVYTFI